MGSYVKEVVKRVPVLRECALGLLRIRRRMAFSSSADYWEQNYAMGGISGVGSLGRLAEFKAEIINGFVAENSVQSVLEFGCGDGRQLALARYPTYIGLDVSATAVRMCQQRFASDETKSFFLYDPKCFADHLHVFHADLVLSLDVLYHLVEDEVFEAVVRHMFAAADRHVIIYSSDREVPQTEPHVRERRITPWIAERFEGWKLRERIPPRYPSGQRRASETSDAEFLIYHRSTVPAGSA